ncbi:metal-binding protein [Methylolobus aquaticus]|nr:metal-binding protein [Methylolobus aquaticus]
MSKGLPDIIDPVDFAEKGRVVSGAIPLGAMERLRDQMVATSGEVRFRLEFGKEGVVVGARGRVEAEVVLQCQSCLGDLAYAIDREVALGFVGSIEQADRLPEPFEPVILDEPRVLRVAEIVEDEILLSIPQVPRHEVCETVGQEAVAAGADGNVRRRPFADLAGLFPSNTKQN